LTHRQAEIRCALEDGDGCCVFGCLLRELDTCATGSDNGDALALVVYAAGGPERGVVHLAFEAVEAFPVGEVALGCEADGIDEDFGGRGAAVFGVNCPALGVLVELCADDAAVEGCVFLDFEDFLDVLEVVPEFLIVGVLLLPCPVL